MQFSLQILFLNKRIRSFRPYLRFVLERHLKQTEVIWPKEEIGKFRGEPVYPRTNVLSLKTPENWLRIGRRVKEGCQPLKMVKHKAVTLNKRRELEIAQADGQEPMMQGLYALDQTEVYVADPVIDVSSQRHYLNIQ